MKKRITAWVMTGLMCLCQLAPSGYTAYADNDGGSVTATSRIVGEEASGLAPGDKFYVDVSVSPFSGSAFALNAAWDTDDLELTNAVAGKDFYSGSVTPSTYVPFYKNGSTTVPEQALKDYESNKSSDVCVFAYASGADLSCSGVAVTLEFTVKQDAENGLSEVNVYFDKKNPPKRFGSGYEGINIKISESSDPEHDGKVEAEITGGKEINTGLAGLKFGSSKGTLEPEFSQRIREYTFIVPPDEPDIPQIEAVLSLGATVSIDQATGFDTNNTAVISVHAKNTNIYKVHFVRQTSAAKPVIQPSSGEIERNTIISITGKGTIYYTIDGSDPDISDSSQIYKKYFTAETAGVPVTAEGFTVKAVSVEDGLDPSDVVQVTYAFPGQGAKATRITVNGSQISNFAPDTRYYMYQISYEEWMRGSNRYTIEAFPINPSAKVEYIPGNVISFDCDRDEKGAGDEKQVEIRIDTGDSFANYIIYFMVDDCKHSSRMETDNPATCEESGEYIVACRTCGKIYYHEVGGDALGHLPGEPVVTEADCITDGLSIVICQRENCGKELSREVIPAYGHTPGEEVTIPADCGRAGSRTVSCTVCGNEISREVLAPTGNHVWSDYDGIQKCMNCGVTWNEAAPPVIEHGHIYNGESSIITAATCTVEGSRQIKCSVENCEAYIVEKVPMLPHTEVTETTEPTCTKTGTVKTICAVCGTTVSEVTTSAKGHSFEFEDVHPNCTEPVILEGKCSVCGAAGIKTIEPTGSHDIDPDNWKTDKNGHCHVCLVCGRNVNIGVHSEGEGVVTREPTSEREGVMTYYCSVCGYEMRTASIPKLWTGAPDAEQTVRDEASVPDYTGPGLTDESSGVSVRPADQSGDLTFVYTDANGIQHTIDGDGSGSVTLNVERLENALTGENKVSFESMYNVDTVAVLDISLEYNGIEVQPNGKIKVTINAPQGTNGTLANIYHMDASGGITDMNAVYDSSTNTLSFLTDHFSIYIIANRSDISSAYPGGIYPEMDDSSSDGPAGRADDVSAAAGASDRAGDSIKMIAIACTVVLAVGFVLLMTKKQKRKNNGSDRIK